MAQEPTAAQMGQRIKQWLSELGVLQVASSMPPKDKIPKDEHHVLLEEDDIQNFKMKSVSVVFTDADNPKLILVVDVNPKKFDEVLNPVRSIISDFNLIPKLNSHETVLNFGNTDNAKGYYRNLDSDGSGVDYFDPNDPEDN